MSSIRTANAHRALEFTTDDNNTPIGLIQRQRLAGLLTGGFLLPQPETQTGSRTEYIDELGRFGDLNTSYYFDSTNNAWFDADVDGNELIRFP